MSKSGDNANQLVTWTFSGVEPGRNTSVNGIVYISVTKQGPGYVVSAFANQDRTTLVAVGARNSPSGLVRLTPGGR